MKSALCSLLILWFGTAVADPVKVRHAAGTLHGFLAMETLEGKPLATGDLVQTVSGGRVMSRLTFHFRDGSVDEETTVFTQNRVLHMVSDHHIQKGPFFPHQLDFTVNATGQVSSLSTDKDGKEKREDGHMDLPPDLGNGLPLTIVLNLTQDDVETKVPLLLVDGKPTMVQLVIHPDGKETFTAAGAKHQAERYAAKIDISGIKGLIAPILGKEPKDYHLWIADGPAPVFLPSEGQLYAEGPVVRIQQVSANFPAASESSGAKP